MKKKQQSQAQRRHAVFMRKTYATYRHMRQRYIDRLPKKPAKLRSGAELPFTIEDLRTYAASRIGRNCRYCGDTLTPKSMSVDHRVPVSRGGSWEMKNLQVLCQSCNQAKGDLTSKEFEQISEVLDTFETAVRRRFIGRLKAGAAVGRMWFIKNKNGEKT